MLQLVSGWLWPPWIPRSKLCDPRDTCIALILQLATFTVVWTSGRFTRLLNWQCTLCPEVPGLMLIKRIWVIGWVFVVGKHGASVQGFWSQKKDTFWQPLSHREEVQDWKSFDLASWWCHQSSFVFSCVNPTLPFPTSYPILWFCLALDLALMI